MNANKFFHVKLTVWCITLFSWRQCRQNLSFTFPQSFHLVAFLVDYI